MNTILLTDAGGRGDALWWKLQQRNGPYVYVAPGTGRTASHGRSCPSVADLRDVSAMAETAVNLGARLVVGGAELPLVAGLSNLNQARGIPTVGPTASAARIEGSKSALKYLCEREGIPTATSCTCDTYEEAVRVITETNQLVVKADYPCFGKGVIVAKDEEGARIAAHQMLVERRFGDAGSRVVIEERLHGREISVHYLCDGVHLLELPTARDYKLLGDLNTGGMGTYSPVPDVTAQMETRIKQEIALPLLRALAWLGSPFHGFLYLGIMWTDEGPKLLEANVRLGDPEAQVMLPRIESDLLPYLEASTRLGGLADMEPLHMSDEAAVCVVLALKGYPEAYASGFPVHGLREAAEHALVFHAGTRYDGAVRPTLPYTAVGGRFLNLVGRGSTIAEARERAYRAVECISLGDGGEFVHRDDIALGV